VTGVILKDAPIFVLNEPTRVIDSVTEAQIQERLAVLMEGSSWGLFVRYGWRTAICVSVTCK